VVHYYEYDDAERWKVLGRATRWSEENVPTLANTTLVGGDPGRGSVYGYLAFTKPSQKERQADAILTCRNPSNRAQTLKLPFDATTWYRGKKGTTYTAEVVYPYTEKLSTLFVSGKENQLTVPPYSTLVLHFHESAGVKKGMLPVSTTVTPAKIAWAGKMSDNFVVRPFELKKDKNATTPVKPTPPEQVTSDQLRFSVTLPAGKLPRCELLVTGKNSEVTLAVDGKVLTPHRRNEGNSWQMNAFDLAPFAGKKVNLQIHGAAKAMDKKDAIFSVATAPALISDITLLVDHPVKATTTKEDEKLPFPIADGYRRKTYPLGLPQGGVRISFPEAAATATAKVKLSDADLGKVKAAKLRLRIFGSNAGGVEQKKIFLNGEPVADVPTCAGDDWYSVIVTLDAAALKKIKRNNAFQLGTQGGDKYKFGNLILAVQLPDGNWVTTNQDDGVHCYDASWKFSEGTPFGKDKKSVPIELEFKK